METITFEVDGEPVSTAEKVLTPVQIMTLAGLNPATHYLVELQGEQHQKSYEGNPNEPIHLHPKLRFIAPSKEPATVSEQH